jgi:drug/metabolite transporter (DMT)-like permease
VTLDPVVAALVLLAAVLHAAWNAITKSSQDPLLAIWLITLVAGVVGAIGATGVPLPHPEAWPYLIASMGIHLAYMLFLVHAYQHGDLNRVYPIARGLAPVVVAALAAALAGESLTLAQTVGLVICCGAISSLAFADAGLRGVSGRAVSSAVMTGLLIGAYTVVDGSGARRAGEPLSYVAWNFMLDAFPISIAAFALRRGRIRSHLRIGLLPGVAGGVMSAIAYGIVMWALARAPMASVASLRETSVVFAALLGARVLGEPLGKRRLAAAVVVAAGLVLLQN